MTVRRASATMPRLSFFVQEKSVTGLGPAPSRFEDERVWCARGAVRIEFIGKMKGGVA